MLQKLAKPIFFLIILWNSLNCHQGHQHHEHHEHHELPEYIKDIDNIFQHNFSKILISILFISLPSLPVFLLLKFITKFFQKGIF